jgi:hypothetical protein
MVSTSLSNSLTMVTFHDASVVELPQVLAAFFWVSDRRRPDYLTFWNPQRGKFIIQNTHKFEWASMICFIIKMLSWAAQPPIVMNSSFRSGSTLTPKPRSDCNLHVNLSDILLLSPPVQFFLPSSVSIYNLSSSQSTSHHQNGCSCYFQDRQ